MAVMVLDCPHCGVKKSAFTVHFIHRQPNNHRYVILGTCNGCNGPLTAELEGVSKPSEHNGDLLSAKAFTVLATYPEPRPIEIPDQVPDNVAKAFAQAAENRKSGHKDAAAAMYRTAMERALKAHSPEISAWLLEKRIDKMASEGKITKELQDWAHTLRLDGNDAVHGDDDATEEMVDDMHELCHFLLIYLYSLPAQVQAARTRRNPPPANPA